MSRPPLEHFTVRFSAGELIYADGDQASTMFVVQKGEVRLYREVDGAETELGVMGKGDFFGEMSILEGIPRSGFARALVDSELLEINSVTFDKMIKGNIEIAVRLLRKLSLRLREAEKRNAELLQQFGRGRISHPDVGLEEVAPPEPEVDAPVEEAPAAAPGPRLEVADGPTYEILIDDCVIGRFDPVTDESPDVDLTEVDLKRSVSRRHARIRSDGDAFQLIEEIGALNGTFLNGEKLSTGEPQPLSDGDRVSVGTVQMLFRC